MAKKSKTRAKFEEAFAAARKGGAKDFSFEGKKYNTKLKGSDGAKAAKPAKVKKSKFADTMKVPGSARPDAAKAKPFRPMAPSKRPAAVGPTSIPAVSRQEGEGKVMSNMYRDRLGPGQRPEATVAKPKPIPPTGRDRFGAVAKKSRAQAGLAGAQRPREQGIFGLPGKPVKKLPLPGNKY